MKSIYHLYVSTPEEFRQELVKWFEDNANRSSDQARFARTKRDQSRAITEMQTYNNAAVFWSEIIIDTPKEPSQEQHYIDPGQYR